MLTRADLFHTNNQRSLSLSKMYDRNFGFWNLLKKNYKHFVNKYDVSHQIKFIKITHLSTFYYKCTKNTEG